MALTSRSGSNLQATFQKCRVSKFVSSGWEGESFSAVHDIWVIHSSNTGHVIFVMELFKRSWEYMNPSGLHWAIAWIQINVMQFMHWATACPIVRVSSDGGWLNISDENNLSLNRSGSVLAHLLIYVIVPSSYHAVHLPFC